MLSDPDHARRQISLEKKHSIYQEWRYRSARPFHDPQRHLTQPMEEKNELRKSEELRSFLFLTVVMVPVLTVMFIAAYGFVVWSYQMLIGGPPHH